MPNFKHHKGDQKVHILYTVEEDPKMGFRKASMLSGELLNLANREAKERGMA